MIFPKRCVSCKTMGSYLCPNCFALLSFDAPSVCLICNRGSLDGLTHPACRGRYTIDGLYSALVYKGVVKRLIYQFKYKPYVTDLASVLGDLFYESLIQQEGFMRILQTKPIFVSIPLHSSRFKSRGYNHAQILTRQLTERFSLRNVELLKRVKKTVSQFGLNREERKENISGAFALTPNISKISKYSNIILVDDIVTTGTTMQEAAKVLKIAGVQKVWGVALAKG